ncbi:hypothetical protein K461DRAFT_297534 [Myriangium duriaei CBS 260.36]|uniref:Polyprenal reductase n=1 Tax=Myriangium duriaei CBS 260.36 TaxID=1168546 RepID=A0A9P4IWN0_9PEZI|nr:hypothetical protein K461DRAFT_297534 [Myriangium duriaei CBS 260.36]
MDNALSTIATLDAITIIRSLFLLPAATILALRSLPPLATRFLPYGSRAAFPAPTPKAKSPPSFFAAALDWAATLTVPHAWFGSFYAISLLGTLFWTLHFDLNTRLLHWLAEHAGDVGRGMEKSQLLVVWAMMGLQGARRLWECITLGKESKAKMWVGHWVMGVGFYVLVNVAVGVEGVGTVVDHPFTWQDLTFTAPSLHTFVATLMFILASGMQHDCHAYLASLKKYTVPQHPVFASLVCPHYFAECVIYLAMAVQAAPKGYMINRTMVCAVVFVAVNLGVTADGTKRWYEGKFGPESVRGKWRMIPFVF